MTKVTLLLGTARKDNESQKVFNFVTKELEENNDIELKKVSVENFLFGRTIPNWADAEASKDWNKIISDTDALFIVVPEYNHSFPGELKILLDTLYDEYAGKIAAVIGVSAGGIGGARMADQLKLLLTNLNFTVVNRTGSFGPVKDLFDESGVIKEDKKERQAKQINGLLEEMNQKLGNK